MQLPYRLLFLLPLLTVACNTGKNPGDSSGDTSHTTSNGFCAVRDVFDAQCVSCHSPSNLQGDLDLVTDPQAALVGVASPTYGTVLVVAGDSASSFLYQKVTGTQGASGDSMPPGATLGAADAETIRTWIDNGATSDCSAPDTGANTFHVSGYADAGLHGMDAKYQALVCIDCHGSDLTGGSAGVSCDSCHETNWRTDCVFCHGGTDNTTGAPPVDIDNLTTSLSFPEHTNHLDRTIHPEWDCVQCHVKPTDVLSSGHLFVGDATAGVAEVTFSGGLSSGGTYGSSCTVYCHGSGQRGSTGSVSSGASESCHMCHGDASNSHGLSGRHGDHFEERVTCNECHSTVAGSNTTISNPDKHVDGNIDVALPSGMTWSSGTCNGSCHDQNHHNERW